MCLYVCIYITSFANRLRRRCLDYLTSCGWEVVPSCLLPVNWPLYLGTRPIRYVCMVVCLSTSGRGEENALSSVWRVWFPTKPTPVRPFMPLTRFVLLNKTRSDGSQLGEGKREKKHRTTPARRATSLLCYPPPSPKFPSVLVLASFPLVRKNS